MISRHILNHNFAHNLHLCFIHSYKASWVHIHRIQVVIWLHGCHFVSEASVAHPKVRGQAATRPALAHVTLTLTLNPARGTTFIC